MNLQLVTAGDLLKQSKHTKLWKTRHFKIKGTMLTYQYPNKNLFKKYDFTTNSEALRVKNGSVIKLSVRANGRDQVMLLQPPKSLPAAAREALYEKWLSTFQDAIALASRPPSTCKADASAPAKPKLANTSDTIVVTTPVPGIWKQVQKKAQTCDPETLTGMTKTGEQWKLLFAAVVGLASTTLGLVLRQVWVFLAVVFVLFGMQTRGFFTQVARMLVPPSQPNPPTSRKQDTSTSAAVAVRVDGTSEANADPDQAEAEGTIAAVTAAVAAVSEVEAEAGGDTALRVSTSMSNTHRLVAAEGATAISLLTQAVAAATAAVAPGAPPAAAGGWELQSAPGKGKGKGVNVFLQRTRGLTHAMGSGVVAAPLHVVLAAVTDVAHKKALDPHFKDQEQVEDLTASSPAALAEVGSGAGVGGDVDCRRLVVVHMRTNAIFPLSARDAVAAVAVASTGDGSVLVAARSVDHPGAPATAGSSYVRAKSIVSGFALARCGPADPATGLRQHTRLTCVSAVDPNGDIPQWLVNKLAPQKAMVVDAVRRLPFVSRAAAAVAAGRYTDVRCPEDLRALCEPEPAAAAIGDHSEPAVAGPEPERATAPITVAAAAH